MPRRNHPRRAGRPGAGGPRPLGGGLGDTRSESAADGQWAVRPVPGGRAVKQYRCPGCDHEIFPGVAHIVAWPADEHGSARDRRHWHTGCWASRQRRMRG